MNLNVHGNLQGDKPSHSHSHSPIKDLTLANGNRIAQNVENLNFGGIIQKSQVFRFQVRNFPDIRNANGFIDLRNDFDSDLTEYVEQL
jgi:hypothetical protein